MSLAQLKLNAENNVIPYTTLKSMLEGKHPPIGDFANFVLNTEESRIVFSIEDQRGTFCRHVSISFNENTPKPLYASAVKQYLEELGFNSKAPFQHIWEESTPFGVALNFLQVMP